MRSYIVWIIAGVVAVIIGLTAIAAAAAPQDHRLGLSIPTNYRCLRYQFDLVTAGQVSGTFTVTSGTVDVYVMTEAQHTAFVAGTGTSFLTLSTGSDGTFFAALPSGGTYFVETCHGAGSAGALQIGLETVHIEGVAGAPFVVGVVALVAAAVLFAVGAWWRQRPARPAVLSMPYGFPPPYPYGPATEVPPWPPAQVPPAAGPSGPPTAVWGGAWPAYGTIVVTVENASGADESVHLLVNGAPAAALTVPAGKSGQASLRAEVAMPQGSFVRVEAQTGAGGKVEQAVFVAAGGTVAVSLRIG